MPTDDPLFSEDDLAPLDEQVADLLDHLTEEEQSHISFANVKRLERLAHTAYLTKLERSQEFAAGM